MQFAILFPFYTESRDSAISRSTLLFVFPLENAATQTTPAKFHLHITPLSADADISPFRGDSLCLPSRGDSPRGGEMSRRDRGDRSVRGGPPSGGGGVSPPKPSPNQKNPVPPDKFQRNGILSFYSCFTLRLPGIGYATGRAGILLMRYCKITITSVVFRMLSL